MPKKPTPAQRAQARERIFADRFGHGLRRRVASCTLAPGIFDERDTPSEEVFEFVTETPWAEHQRRRGLRNS